MSPLRQRPPLISAGVLTITGLMFWLALPSTWLLSPKVNWSTSFDAGFGGSNGTYNFTTAISWRFWKYMSIGPNFSFMAIDYENGERGDSDWYLYDANEFGWGASCLIHF